MSTPLATPHDAPLDARHAGLVLGGNVFGGTVEQDDAFRILDAFFEQGGRHIDTADVYANWVPGRVGGESESIIGRWMHERGVRDDVIVATKVGLHPDVRGLAPETIARGIESSCERLGTDRIDIYYAHIDDRRTPLDETLSALSALVDDGRVDMLGASNYRSERLEEALTVASDLGLHPFRALQAHYNLVHRDEFESGSARTVMSRGMLFFPYFSLASGFLTGKYRSVDDLSGARAKLVGPYVTPEGLRILDEIEVIAASHGVPTATIALAWLDHQGAVTAPMASASSVAQLAPMLAARDIRLTVDELARLDTVSAASGRA